MSGKGTPLHGDETVIDDGRLGDAEEKGPWIMRSGRQREQGMRRPDILQYVNIPIAPLLYLSRCSSVSSLYSEGEQREALSMGTRQALKLKPEKAWLGDNISFEVSASVWSQKVSSHLKTSFDTGFLVASSTIQTIFSSSVFLMLLVHRVDLRFGVCAFTGDTKE